jgi:hypothetical protein
MAVVMIAHCTTVRGVGSYGFATLESIHPSSGWMDGWMDDVVYLPSFILRFAGARRRACARGVVLSLSLF